MNVLIFQILDDLSTTEFHASVGSYRFWFPRSLKYSLHDLCHIDPFLL